MDSLFADPGSAITDGPHDRDTGDRLAIDLTDRARQDRARLISGLNEQQAAAVLSPSPALRIIAGAGSGKTRVLTRRIARRVAEDEVDPRRVLAVTFTRKAASELRQRIDHLGLRGGINAGTFHAIAFTQLRQRWEERRVTPPTLLDRKVGFVARLMRGGGSSTLPLDVVSEIEWAKARMISAADYPVQAQLAARRTPISADAVADIYARYEKAKLDRLMVDFDDLLRLATRDIEADPEFAKARRWRFRHLFVDEFQDVNPLQFRLLTAWVGPDVDLCVVGDPNQAIYAWNGADSRFLDDFDTHFPGSTTIELADNYRSSPQILGLANTVLSQTSSRRFDLVPHRADGPVPSIEPYADEVNEARGLARRCRDAHRPGGRWSDQAVLVRTNAQLAVIAEAFTSAGIPHRSRGGVRLLDQPEVKDVLRRIRNSGGSLGTQLADLEAQLPTNDESPIVGRPDDATNSPVDDAEYTAGERPGSRPDGGPRLDSDGDFDAATPGSEPHRTALRSNRTGWTDERAANVAEIVRLGREFLDLEPEGSGATFVAWLDSALRQDDGSASNDAVDLLTFHAAKGLEWPIVYVAGLEEGLVPIHYADSVEAEAEETRLLYVAFTRAEQQLTLTWANRRTFGTRSQTRRRSPLLERAEIAVELMAEAGRAVDLSASVAAVAAERAKLRANDGEGRSGRADRRVRGASGRSAAAELDADDQALFDRLKTWRIGLARANDVPAYVIFNDATLAEIARCRPANNRELLAVNGVGSVKAQRFGPDVLKVIAEG